MVKSFARPSFDAFTNVQSDTVEFWESRLDRLRGVPRFFQAALFLLAAGIALAGEARAQDSDIDWADAGLGSLTPFPSGTTVAGSDGTTATVTWNVQTQGPESFEPVFGNDFVAYFGGSVGGNASPLIASFDNARYDPRDRITLTITLNRAVRDLNFALSDIDFANSSTTNFRDAVEVRYAGDLSGSFTNASNNTAFWTAGSAVSRTNDATVNGWRGVGSSATAATGGNIAFDFGSTAVRRIQITYFSYTDPAPNRDPTLQFMSISDLTYSQPSADLSLTKQLVSTVPTTGSDATWRLTVTNDSVSDLSASGIIVRDTLPSDFVFDSANGTGTFNPANGEWAVGTLAPGASVSIDITGAINAPGGTTVTNTAEIIASSVFDPDSTPNNGQATEDDFASATFTVVDFSMNAPVLSCPVGQTVFDWDSPAVTWIGGATTGSYPLAGYGSIDFDITGGAIFSPRGSFGGAVPALTTAVGGGLSPSELALAYNANNTNRNQQFITTIRLPRTFDGVQFTIFDIDSSNGFQDRITAYGLLNGVRVNAIMTESAQNEANGDTIVGTGGAADNLDIANGTITFLQPIDTIVFEYGNGPAAPNNPTNQSIALHDIVLCNPLQPRLSVTKVSSIFADPVNGTNNPKGIPGAVVEYLISVSNTGQGATDADSVVVTDDHSADIKLCRLDRVAGPLVFSDPGGGTGLTYSYVAAGNSGDDIEFSSTNGSNFGYNPVLDADGCDANITGFRVNLGGAMAAGSTFTLRARYIIVDSGAPTN